MGFYPVCVISRRAPIGPGIIDTDSNQTSLGPPISAVLFLTLVRVSKCLIYPHFVVLGKGAKVCAAEVGLILRRFQVPQSPMIKFQHISYQIGNAYLYREQSGRKGFPRE